MPTSQKPGSGARADLDRGGLAGSALGRAVLGRAVLGESLAGCFSFLVAIGIMCRRQPETSDW